MNKNDFEIIKSKIDDLTVQAALLTTRQQAILSMILSVYRETLSIENYNKAVLTFCDYLGDSLMDAVGGLDEVLFEKGTVTIRLKTDVLGEIQHIKNAFLLP